MGKPNSSTHAAPGAGPVTGDEAAGGPVALSGKDWRRLLTGGTTWLERNAAAVDALNVFPVPDGDTGKNMLLTMRAALEGAGRAKDNGADTVLRAAAQAAVMGARGNSGVILSQIVAGIARAVGEADTCDGDTLARAIAEGADMAYRAVTRPVEGTILTVARAAGEAALGAVQQEAGGASCLRVLEQATAAAHAAVRRTPEQLPVLRQAGVVDAGGEGYRVILEGMTLTLRGEALPEAVMALEPVAVSPVGVAADLDAAPGEEWGYCTQFVIRGEALDVARVREELQALAESALVVGDETALRVHGHTEDPGQLLSYAVRYGRLQRISIEDMDAQHDDWLRRQVEESAQPDGLPAGKGPGTTPVEPAVVLATVAVAPGEGFADVFRSLGVAAVVPGGQTMNPSAQDILDAARKTGARTVLVLPNNGNVVMTAQQAARVGAEQGLRLVVVPTRTVPQGIAAQLAFDPDASPEQNARGMEEGAAGVRTVEITRATRSVTMDGVAIQTGDALGLLDDKLVTAAADPLVAAREAMDRAGAAQAEIITVYRGASPGEAEADTFVRTLREAYPQAEIEVVPGGQPHYDFVISVE